MTEPNGLILRIVAGGGAPLPEELASRIPESNKPGRVTGRLTAAGDGELVLFGDIGGDITALGVRNALATLGTVANLTVRIHSNGGDVLEGFAIYNALARNTATKTVVVEGLAASMASFIAMVGNKIVMPANSFMMIHSPSGFVVGTAEYMREVADILDRLRDPMVATYAARTGQTPDAILEMLGTDTWFSADAAKEAGFCDEVEAPIAAAAALDLSRFRNVPKALAMSPAPIPAPKKEPTPMKATLAQLQAIAAANGLDAAWVVTQLSAEATVDAAATDAVALKAARDAANAPTAIASLERLQDIANRGGLDSDWVVAQLTAKVTVQAAQDKAIDAIAAKATTPRNPANPAAVITRDERDTKRDLMANALAHRAAPGRTKLEDGARQFRGMNLVAIARECLEDAGVKTRGMTSGEIAQLALNQHQFRAAGGDLSSSDFPDLLRNTASKSLRDGYASARRTFPLWAQQKNLPDFKTFKEVALSGAPALNQIDETGEISFGKIGDAAESWNLVRYGKRVNISYVAIINDDMGGFDRIPTMFGNAASRLESETVYGIFNSNPTMADTGAVFNATAVATAGGHANQISGGGSALTNDATGVANVTSLLTKLRKVKAPNGDTLNLDGRFLLIPAELEGVARSMFSARVVPATTGAVNPYLDQFEVITEPRLTSTTAFYLIAAQNQIDTVHYGYLEGEEGPVIASEIEFANDGMSIKCTHNFGCAAIDWRGMAKSVGA